MSGDVSGGEGIVAMRKQGRTLKEIAERTGCSLTRVWHICKQARCKVPRHCEAPRVPMKSCPDCGKKVKAQGIGTHRRMAHRGVNKRKAPCRKCGLPKRMCACKAIKKEESNLLNMPVVRVPKAGSSSSRRKGINVKAVQELRGRGWTLKAIAEKVGCSVPSIWYICTKKRSTRMPVKKDYFPGLGKRGRLEKEVAEKEVVEKGLAELFSECKRCGGTGKMYVGTDYGKPVYHDCICVVPKPELLPAVPVTFLVCQKCGGPLTARKSQELRCCEGCRGC